MSKKNHIKAIQTQTEAKLTAVFDNAAVGIDLLNTEGKILYTNTYLQTILGYSENELNAKNIFDITVKDDLEKTKTLYSKLVNGELDFYRIEKRYIKSDGTILWADLSVTPLKDSSGKVIEIIGVILDISERKAAQEALLIREQEYRALFSNLRDVFLRMDTDGYILMISPSCFDVTGYTPGELVGLNVFENSLQPHRVQLFKNKLLEFGVIDQYETKIQKKDGSIVWVSVTARLIKDKFGSDAFIEGTVRDITSSIIAENKLKEALSHYRFLIDTMGEGLIKTDKDFKITFGNGAFCNMIGKAQNKIHGMTPFDFISENEAQFLAIRLKRFDNGNESFELNLIHENGNTVPVLVTPRAFYTPEGELNGVVIVITEITKQKSTELALKESEKKLQEALSVKDKFFSIIAHDMKGPMGNFLGLSKVLNKDIEEMTMKDLKETASSIYDSANSIYKLLEDLLQWSRTQMGNISFNPEPIDLQELAFNNIYLLSASAKEKMIDLSSKIKSPVYVHGDRNMLTTVIRNLTSNAIKFTEEGGKITFDVVAEDSEFVTVCIEDTGIGMEEEVASNLFNPEHHHTSLGTNAEKGTGLGLVLCKEFVQKHGGRIWVRSQINLGSKFYFTVPKYRGDLAI